MDIWIFWIVIASVLAATTTACRALYWKGRIDGTIKSITEIGRGISAHYEHEGKALPTIVSAKIDEMKVCVAKSGGNEAKCRRYDDFLWDVGHSLGTASWHDGYQAGQEFGDVRKGEIRIDMTLESLKLLTWMSYKGFRDALRTGDFGDKTYAEKASEAIDLLEANLPTESLTDPSSRYSQSFDRFTMIFDRYRPYSPNSGI